MRLVGTVGGGRARCADEIAAGFANAAQNLDFHPGQIQTARDATMAVMDLMSFCHTMLPPEKICQVYNEARPGTHKNASKDPAVLKALWDNCGDTTIEVIAAGPVTLGAIWEAAWKVAGASDQDKWLTQTYDGARDLMPIYGSSCARCICLIYGRRTCLDRTLRKVLRHRPPEKRMGHRRMALHSTKKSTR